jgi:hypothetical protein
MARPALTRTRNSGVIVLLGDMLCFLIFALVGLRSHEDGITAASLLRTAVPFQVGWLLTSTAIGLQSFNRTPIVRPGKVLTAWSAALLLGLAARSLFFGREFALTFAVITFLFNAVLLIGWRHFLVPLLFKTDATPRH